MDNPTLQQGAEQEINNNDQNTDVSLQILAANGNDEASAPGSMTSPQQSMENGDFSSVQKDKKLRGSMLGARGGPLFMPGLVSPYTSVREFEASVSAQLTRLQEELCDDRVQVDDIDVSVEDLKIITDEELVNRVFKEAFKGSSETQVIPGLTSDTSTENVPQNHVDTSEGQAQGEESGQEIQGDAPSNTCLNLATENTYTSAGTHDTISTENKRSKGRNNDTSGTKKKQRRGGHYDRETRAAELQGSSETQVIPGLTSNTLTENVPQNHVDTGEGQTQGEKAGQEIQGDAPSNTCLNLATENISTSAETHVAISTENKKRKERNNDNSGTKKKKRRGRHYDRETRAAELQSDVIQKAESLAKLKHQQEEDKAVANLHSLKSRCNEGSSNKFENMEGLKSLKFITSNLKTKLISQSEHEPVRNPEVVLCVEFYHNIRKEHKIQEFLLLGRQPLTVLRDKLYCLTDQLMQKAGKHVPSGYFMIENVFYNDFRDPAAINYSRPIISWVQNQKDEALEKWKAIIAAGFKKKQRALLRDSLPSDQLPYFEAADMSKTCFADLQFRLGVRYLYCHQGDCKHGIVIRDMRLIHPEDNQNKVAYPLLTFQPRVRHRKCTICDIYRAKKITYDDKWAPANPSFFCENCYYLLHYNQDGTLMYDGFRVYDYYHE